MTRAALQGKVLPVDKFASLFWKAFQKKIKREPYLDDKYKRLLRDFVEYFYCLHTGQEGATWDTHKGVYLWGRTGIGKTTLFQAMSEVLNALRSPVRIKMIGSFDLSQNIYQKVAEGHFSRYSGLPWNCVDDFMRESSDGKMNVYGTKIVPSAVFVEWAYIYWRNGTKFFFTSNFPPNHMLSFDESLDHAVSRLYEMCNVIKMPDIDDLRIRFAQVVEY